MLKLQNIDLSKITPKSAFVTCAGFEDRAPVAMLRTAELGLNFSKSIIATYVNAGTAEAENNAKAVNNFEDLSRKLVDDSSRRVNICLEPATEFEQKLARALLDVEHVFCDITGFNTSYMFAALNAIFSTGKSFSILYTEAMEYFPTRSKYESYFSHDYIDGDLASIENYETSSSMYSNTCDVDFIRGFQGSASPGYPYFLLAFLPFKRSRLGAVLQEIAAAKQLLIVGKPVRSELSWRTAALKEINRDIIQESDSNIVELSTLSIDDTLQMFENHLDENGNRYRYNFIIAPLGSKVQKVACWIFATRNPRISVISSTPLEIYPESYSTGFIDTFVSQNVQNYVQ